MRRAFGRSAESYEKNANLQFVIGQRLLRQLDGIDLIPGTILDIGCGTGWGSVALLERFPQTCIVAMDLALPMLKLAQKSKLICVCGDAERLPIRFSSVDMIYSNAMLQWCNDLQQVFIDLRQILTYGGVFLFTTFGINTLNELRHAWSEADNYPHVSSFLDIADVQCKLQYAGFANIELRQEQQRLTYRNVWELMYGLKKLGAGNAILNRTKGLTGKTRFAAMLQSYEKLRVANTLPVTYEVIYGVAWNLN